MAMETPPFEDVFPIKTGDFPASHVSFGECHTVLRKLVGGKTLAGTHLHDAFGSPISGVA